MIAIPMSICAQDVLDPSSKGVEHGMGLHETAAPSAATGEAVCAWFEEGLTASRDWARART